MSDPRNFGRMRLGAADLEAQRQALEAAGRAEWDRATREGRNVLARTPQELRELGARVLARRHGAAGSTEAYFPARSGPGPVVVATAQAAPDVVSPVRVDEDDLVEPIGQVSFEPSLGDQIRKSVGSRIYARLEADWDPARSNGVTAMPTPEMLDAGEAYKGKHTVKNDDEALAFLVPDANGGFSLAPAVGKVKTGSSEGGYYAEAHAPSGSGAGIHWHDDARADGFVDDPDTPRSRGYGDYFYLQNKKPMATVYRNEVGWNGVENGRLVFVYPIGTMTDQQLRRKQRNMNREQKKFYTKK